MAKTLIVDWKGVDYIGLMAYLNLPVAPPLVTVGKLSLKRNEHDKGWLPLQDCSEG